MTESNLHFMKSLVVCAASVRHARKITRDALRFLYKPFQCIRFAFSFLFFSFSAHTLAIVAPRCSCAECSNRVFFLFFCGHKHTCTKQASNNLGKLCLFAEDERANKWNKKNRFIFASVSAAAVATANATSSLRGAYTAAISNQWKTRRTTFRYACRAPGRGRAMCDAMCLSRQVHSNRKCVRRCIATLCLCIARMCASVRCAMSHRCMRNYLAIFMVCTAMRLNASSLFLFVFDPISQRARQQLECKRCAFIAFARFFVVAWNEIEEETLFAEPAVFDFVFEIEPNGKCATGAYSVHFGGSVDVIVVWKASLNGHLGNRMPFWKIQPNPFWFSLRRNGSSVIAHCYQSPFTTRASHAATDRARHWINRYINISAEKKKNWN